MGREKREDAVVRGIGFPLASLCRFPGGWHCKVAGMEQFSQEAAAGERKVKTGQMSEFGWWVGRGKESRKKGHTTGAFREK